MYTNDLKKGHFSLTQCHVDLEVSVTLHSRRVRSDFYMCVGDLKFLISKGTD